MDKKKVSIKLPFRNPPQTNKDVAEMLLYFISKTNEILKNLGVDTSELDKKYKHRVALLESRR